MSTTDSIRGMAYGRPANRDRLRLPARAENLLEIDAEAFRACFNRKPFIIRHGLARHDLFTLPRLTELSRRLPEEDVKFNTGEVPVDLGLYRGERTGLSIQETIRQIEERRSWMVLKFVERDPEYRELLNRCLDEIGSLSEPIDPGMCKREGFIFISSPGSVTPYHLDPEYNFLLQIRGNKTINIWNSDDRSVLSEQELEGYFSNRESQISYREQYQRKATTFELAPGSGLHFPVTAPHWVKNGDEVSVSFSITFRTPGSDRRGIVYTVNDYLRRRGIKPSPVGRSFIRDSAKYYAFRALRRARGFLPGSRHRQ